MAFSEGALESLCNNLFNRFDDHQTPHGLTRENAKEIVSRIQNEFEQNKVIQLAFNNEFNDFFSDLLWWSYGYKFDGKLIKNEFKTKSVERGQLAKNINAVSQVIKIIGNHNPEVSEYLMNLNSSQGRRCTEIDETLEGSLLQQVDMFCLIGYLIENYPQKYRSYNNFRREKEIGSRWKKISLVACFNENFWDNIFNDYRSYSGNNGQEICLFNRAKHAVASYLHSAHPDIHYLNIKAEGKKNPLATAILMEGWGGKAIDARDEYIIVEGVLGNFDGMTEQQKEEVYGFLWESIKDYSFNKCKHVFLNTSHSGNQIEPEEFLAYVAKKERINGEIGMIEEKNEERKSTERKTVFILQKSAVVLTDYGKKETEKWKWVNYYFTVNPAPNLTEAISNRNPEGFLYPGYQYTDTFFLANKGTFPTKKHFNSFFSPSGYAQGFEVSCSKCKKSTILPLVSEPVTPKIQEPMFSKTRKPFFRKLALGCLIGSMSILFSLPYVEKIYINYFGENSSRLVALDEVGESFAEATKNCTFNPKTKEIICNVVNPYHSCRLKESEKVFSVFLEPYEPIDKLVCESGNESIVFPLEKLVRAYASIPLFPLSLVSSPKLRFKFEDPLGDCLSSQNDFKVCELALTDESHAKRLVDLLNSYAKKGP